MNKYDIVLSNGRRILNIELSDEDIESIITTNEQFIEIEHYIVNKQQILYFVKYIT